MNIALTIAGSDSGGGAGIQADLKTFHQFGVFGTSVIVAVTSQNTLGVTDIHSVPVKHVESQLAALEADLGSDAFKTGMLASADLVAAVGAAIKNYDLANYVLDPVMVATSGDRLLEQHAERLIAELLMPLATLVTPNIDETAILTGRQIKSVDDMIAAAHGLVEMGAQAALVKGGHMAGEQVTDVLQIGRRTHSFTRQRIHTTSTHGTGCTLSAAVAAGLALGQDLEPAVVAALDFVHRAMRDAPDIGSGHGPLNHLVPAR